MQLYSTPLHAHAEMLREHGVLVHLTPIYEFKFSSLNDLTVLLPVFKKYMNLR